MGGPVMKKTIGVQMRAEAIELLQNLQVAVEADLGVWPSKGDVIHMGLKELAAKHPVSETGTKGKGKGAKG